MRHFILLFLIIATSPFSFGQRGAYGGDIEPREDQVSFDLLIGTHIFSNDFIGQFNTFDFYQAAQPINNVGLALNTFYMDSERFKFGFHYSYTQILPSDVNINDTLNGRINGFNYSMSLASINLTPKSTFSNIAFGIGFNTGRLRMTAENRRSQKNPYFAPALFFAPRFFIGRVAIGLRAEYQLDVSRKTWRSVNVNENLTPFQLNEFRQSGLVTHFSIGWRLI